MRGAIVQLLEALEIELVLGLLIHDISIFLKLVVADIELAVAKLFVVEILQGILCLIRRLEANEGINFLHFVVGEKLDTLNLTKLFEQVFQRLFIPIWREIFDVQIAAFF